MDIKNKNVLVVGNARSGMGSAKLAQKLGANVCIYDGKPFEEWKDEAKQQINKLKSSGISYCLGIEPHLEKYDLVIMSPGISPEIPLADRAKSLGIKITGEFEFSSWYCKAPVIAITGTNGKTTTTTLVGEIMAKHNDKTYVVGNIGKAFSENVYDITEDSIVVAEVSSFQLETAYTFKPAISALLNITPDHLNRHHTMENYCECKYNIFSNQEENGYSILNLRDEYFNEAKQKVKGKLLTFSATQVVECGAYVKDDTIYENINGTEEKICRVDELYIKGTHNVENVLAAICISVAFGVAKETIKEVLVTFKGVEHRTEYVTSKKGVDFFNDSKATNTDAAIAGLIGLSSMGKPIRLIGGGMDKQTSFKDWIVHFKGLVPKLYVIGETKEQIINECIELDYKEVEAFDTLEEAILAAYKDSKPNECILLSPACASWDMFESYEKRGELFKEVVKNLEG